MRQGDGTLGVTNGNSYFNGSSQQTFAELYQNANIIENSLQQEPCNQQITLQLSSGEKVRLNVFLFINEFIII